MNVISAKGRVRVGLKLTSLLLDVLKASKRCKATTEIPFPEVDKVRVAREDEYFHRKNSEQIDQIKLRKVEEEIFHKQQIRRLEDAIEMHKERLKALGANVQKIE